MNLGTDPHKSIAKRILAACAGLFAVLAFAAIIAVRTLPAAYAQAVAGTSTSTASSSSSLQAELDANNQAMAALNVQIAQYQAQLQQVGANKKTLQAAINALDLQKSKVQTQITLTQYQMKTTQLQIQQLGGEITNTQQTIATQQTALGAYLQSLQKADAKPLIEQMLSSGGLVQAWSDLNQTLQIQEGIQNEMQTLKEEENNLADSQTASQQKQNTLTAQQQSLVSTEQSKSQLLTETNAQEATYQKLLATAEAQLNSFSAFAANAGGSKLLGNQTICDSWGCYYNQRDTAWGSQPLDGTKYTMASDGCLVSAMAMVLTHYGYKSVTPETINSDPNNFAAYYPAYLLTSINVAGVTATRKTAAIDATLATGNPVIVGINAYGGTHFVVLVSGSKGNYTMKDPYITNGNNISFSANYSIRSIYAIAKVVIS